MARRRSGRDVHGVLLLDKPPGRSSNQALQDVRRLFNAKKAGHTGNLDPLATGMLPICFGEATKTAGFMLDSEKTYLATAQLGVATETGDIEGEITEEQAVPELDSGSIEAAMSDFRGSIDQLPPMYSALKHQGQPLYKLAREGKSVERKKRTVIIHELDLERWEPPMLMFRVRCSKGTYVRTLAEDLAKALGTCSHLRALRRISVAPFEGRSMNTIELLREAVDKGSADALLLPIDAGLPDWPRIDLTEGQAIRFRHGNPVTLNTGQTAMVRVYQESAEILGLGELLEDGTLHPRRVFLLSE